MSLQQKSNCLTFFNLLSDDKQPIQNKNNFGNLENSRMRPKLFNGQYLVTTDGLSHCHGGHANW